MKKIICIIAGFLLVTGFFFGQTKNLLEVSFDYEKTSGLSSNQFAVWIEDDVGNFIKSLFVTRFTAQKGYKTRPDSVPFWVAKANPESRGLDSASGATPKSGKLLYSWDGTNSLGEPQPDGKYRLLVEASLFKDNRIVYAGDFTLEKAEAKKSIISMSATYFKSQNQNDNKNNNMIVNVQARLP